MRTLLIAATLAASTLTATSYAVAQDFRQYPGFKDKDAFVEMTNDMGLIVEITLRCGRRANGKIKAGIMTYSKLERLYCSSQNRCYRDALKAADQTCGG
jgi:hypothetical protein